MRAEETAERYFAEAQSWEMDRARMAQSAARRAWWVAGLACVVALAAVGAVVGLTPLKQVEPFVVRVNDTSGAVEVVPVYAGEEKLPEAVSRHLITQYVQVRERYVAALAESDYEQVGAYHTAAMNQAWAALWDRANAASPLVTHADGSSVRAQVKAISFLTRADGTADLAQVRFARARFLGGGAEQLTHYIATLQYGYGKPSMEGRLRALNPLGFRVMEYRVEPEVIEAPAAVMQP